MAKKKKTAKGNNSNRTIRQVINVLTFILIVDGIIRIITSSLTYYFSPSFYLTANYNFHLRWLVLGLLELIFAYGLFKRQIWSLYGLTLLSLCRIYTMIVFPPQGIFFPIHSNIFTYLFKLFTLPLIFFLLFKRKYFHSK